MTLGGIAFWITFVIHVLMAALCRESYAEIEEVTVTAEKRVENLQDVPIGISVFTSKDLVNLGISEFRDLTEHVAGAELFDDRGSNQPTWIIRGAGLADFNANNAPTAAVYYDEFYLTSNILNGFGLFDIRQVEVLKGPQGGLYGRNTSGGAIRVLSQAPQLAELAGSLSLSYERWGRTRVSGYLNAPTSPPTGAFRVSMLIDQGGGWQDSLATSIDDEHGDRDYVAGRIQFLVHHTDDIDALVKIDLGRDRSETTLGVATGAYDSLSGDFCAAVMAGERDNTSCVTWSNYTNLALNRPAGSLPSAQGSRGTRTLSSPINELENDWFGANFRINWTTESAVLSWIAGYIDFHSRQWFDFDATEQQMGHEESIVEIDSWSQELRIASTVNGRWSWLTGVVYATDITDENRFFEFADNVFVFGGFPSSNRGFEQKTESLSAFGQARYTINDAWRVQASLRYTNERKRLRKGFTTLNTAVGPIFLIQDISSKYTLGNRWSGDVGAVWRTGADSLLYLNIARGFKSGGFFGGFALTPEELDPYQEETVWSYEIGIKSATRDGTLIFNSELYYYEFDAVQGFTTIASDLTGTPLTKLGNLGKAEHVGIEVEAKWAPDFVDGLRLHLGASWLDASISESDATSVTQDGVVYGFEGLQRIFAPEWSAAIQAAYEFRVPGDLLAAVQVDYSWRDAIAERGAFPNKVDSALGQHDGYDLLGLRLSLGSRGGGWELAVAGKNLNRESYIVRSTRDDVGSYFDIPAAPVRWRVEYRYNWQ